MASSNKPDALWYVVIVSVILLAVASFAAYSATGKLRDESAKLAEANSKAQAIGTEHKKATDDIQALKEQIGHKFDTVSDVGNPGNATSVVGAAKLDIDRFGQTLKGNSYTETLQKLREALDAANKDVASKAAQLAAMQKQLGDEIARLNTQVDTHRAAQEKSEADKRDVISSSDEKLTAKQNEIDDLSSQKNQLTDELSQERESRKNEKKKLLDQISLYEQRIDFMRERYDELVVQSFEEADGKIRRIDTTTNSVWLDLGSADGLKTQMTFGIYAKDGKGVGRGPEDVKGKIEVTEILGPHTAVAKINDSDILRPIVPGDLIYTPIWSPGLVERISIVGLIDLDNDGKSDREQFKDLCAASNCIIDNEVTDDGERVPADAHVTVHTKFLVLGDIPDPATLVNTKDRDLNDKIKAAEKALRAEARSNGVRTVKLNDFLAHVGYNSKRRIYRTGDSKSFNLKAGRPQTLVNNPANDPNSGGTVSQLYSKKKTAPPVSSGTTSQIFGK